MIREGESGFDRLVNETAGCRFAVEKAQCDRLLKRNEREERLGRD
jgi:hypothetical protein